MLPGVKHEILRSLFGVKKVSTSANAEDIPVSPRASAEVNLRYWHRPDDRHDISLQVPFADRSDNLVHIGVSGTAQHVNCRVEYCKLHVVVNVAGSVVTLMRTICKLHFLSRAKFMPLPGLGVVAIQKVLGCAVRIQRV